MAKQNQDSKKNGKIKQWTHVLYEGISYPIRHPFVTMIVLLAFFRHELFDFGVKNFHKITLPYRQEAVVRKKVFQHSEKKVSDAKGVSSEKALEQPAELKQPAEQAKNDEPARYANWNVGKFNKVKFEPLETSPTVTNEASFAEVKQQAQIEKQQKEEILAEGEKITPENKTLLSAQDLEQFYVKKNSLNLEYLPKPEIIFGEMKLVDANSLYVNDRFVYLYGVYSDPEFYDAEAAEKYLVDLVEDKNISCYVVAKSLRNNVGTALCFVDGLFINKLLTEQGYAQNVALQ